MVEFLVNIFVAFRGKVFQQTVGIPMGTNWRIVNQKSRFWDLSWSDVSCWAWDQRHDREQHLYFLLEFSPFYREGWSAAHFPWHITNFPFLSSNIPSLLAFGVFISQLIRHARACCSYEYFILRAAQLSSKLLGEGYVRECLKSSNRKFYGWYGDLIKQYEVSLSQLLHDILGHDHIQRHPQLIRHDTNLWPYYRTWLYYWLWPYYQISGGFHRTLQPVRLANKGRLLFQTPGSVPIGTWICSNVETFFSWTCNVSGLWISIIPLYFYFALQSYKTLL